MPAGADDITANHNDGMSRLFEDRTEFCLYCGAVHTGFGGAFVRFFHDHAHFVSYVTPTLKQYMVATDEGQIFLVR